MACGRGRRVRARRVQPKAPPQRPLGDVRHHARRLPRLLREEDGPHPEHRSSGRGGDALPGGGDPRPHHSALPLDHVHRDLSPGARSPGQQHIPPPRLAHHAGRGPARAWVRHRSRHRRLPAGPEQRHRPGIRLLRRPHHDRPRGLQGRPHPGSETFVLRGTVRAPGERRHPALAAPARGPALLRLGPLLGPPRPAHPARALERPLSPGPLPGRDRLRGPEPRSTP